jgi:hypothetical protein
MEAPSNSQLLPLGTKSKCCCASRRETMIDIIFPAEAATTCSSPSTGRRFGNIAKVSVKHNFKCLPWTTQRSSEKNEKLSEEEQQQKRNQIQQRNNNNSRSGPRKSKVRLQIGAHKRTLSKKEVVKTLSIKIKTCFSIIIIRRKNARAKFTKTENGYQTRTDI